MAGPIARATLSEALFIAIAPGSCSLGTSSGIVACHAGTKKAPPRLRTTVKTSNTIGDAKPDKIRSPSITPEATIHTSVHIKILRLSYRSDATPAGRANKNKGKLVAVCMSAIYMGDGVIEAIYHTPPTSCIHVPMFEAVFA